MDGADRKRRGRITRFLGGQHSFERIETAIENVIR